MILYINGSPGLKKSNSEYFLSKITNENIFYIYKDNLNDLDNLLRKCNTIVFAFPLYVDSPPNRIIELMEYVENNKIDIKDKNIYLIVNCGFLEFKQNQTAIDIMKLFCKNNKAIYKGSFKIGAGAVIGRCDEVKLYRVVSIPFFIKIKKFKKAILKNDGIELSTTIRIMWKRLYIFLANKSWKKQIKHYKKIKN